MADGNQGARPGEKLQVPQQITPPTWTHDAAGMEPWCKIYLERLAVHGVKNAAGTEAGLKYPSASLFHYRKNHPEFKVLEERALDAYKDRIRLRVADAAFNGNRTVTMDRNGQITRVEVKQDQRALMMLAKSQLPNEFDDRMTIDVNSVMEDPAAAIAEKLGVPVEAIRSAARAAALGDDEEE